MKRRIMEEDAQRVLDVLELGMGGAKLSNEIAAEAGIPRERTDLYMRVIARHLNFEGYPVVSDTCGFWLAETREEVEDYRASLMSRVSSLLSRCEKLREIADGMQSAARR